MSKYNFKFKDNENDIVVNATAIKEEWKKSISSAKKKMVKNFKIDGYRPGSKAHASIAAEKISDAMVLEEALNLELRKVMNELITTEDFKKRMDDIYGMPPEINVVSIDENGFEINIIYKKNPKVTLGDYNKLKLSFPKAEVSDEEVSHSIDYWRSKKSILSPKKDAVIENGDVVIFDFKGFIDGKEMENGSGKNFELEIGSNQFIPGFEEQMVGLKKDEEKTITVKFPEDYHAKDIAGKEAKFELKIHDIKTKVLPELDDEFVKEFKIDGVETVAEFKKYEKEQLLTKKKLDIVNEAKPQIFKELAKITKLSFPDEIGIENEIQNMKHEYEQMLSQSGIKLNDFLKMTGKSTEDFDKELKSIAEENVLSKYAIYEISEKEKIEANEKDLKDLFDKVARYQGISIDEVEKMAKPNIDRIEATIVVDKTIEWLINKYTK